MLQGLDFNNNFYPTRPHSGSLSKDLELPRRDLDASSLAKRIFSHQRVSDTITVPFTHFVCEPEEGDPEILPNAPLETTESHQSLMQVNKYQSVVTKYDRLCSKASRALSEGQSNLFNQKLFEAEQALLKVKPDARTDDQKKQIAAMEVRFDELYQKIPSGQSLFFQKDKEKLQALYTKPSEETYSSLHGQFYEPTVTTHELIVFFNDFREKWGYIATSVNLKTDYYYTQEPRAMMTAITFRKDPAQVSKNGKKTSNSWSLASLKDRCLSYFWRDYIDAQSFLDEEGKNDALSKESSFMDCTELSHLGHLLEDLQKIWSFHHSEAGYVNETFGQLKIEGLQNFGSYALLYHKRVN